MTEGEEETAHLKRAVQIWRLAADRHLEVTGPGADELMRQMTPRDLAMVPDGHRAYAPFCGPSGRMLGDPMVLRVAPDVWRLSGAADLGAWIRAYARASRVPVLARPVDLRALAVQGPGAAALVERALGPSAAALGPMRWMRCAFGRGEVLVARSDLSRQGGFEIVVERRDEALRRTLLEAGRDLNARVAEPPERARVEGGLIRWGVDIGPDLTPFEAGLGRLCDGAHEHVGRAALEGAREPRRTVRPLEVEGPPLPRPHEPWPLVEGRVTSAAWAPELGRHVAIGLVPSEWPAGREAAAETPHGPRTVRVRDRFWT